MSSQNLCQKKGSELAYLPIYLCSYCAGVYDADLGISENK